MDISVNSGLATLGQMPPATLALRGFEASRDLIRLDTAIEASPEPVRQGWLRRALIHETAASLRLDGFNVAAHDLVLALSNVSMRQSDLDLLRALEIHGMFSTLLRRNPQRIFNPHRLSALMKLRQREAGHQHEIPELKKQLQSATDMIESLTEVIRPEMVARWQSMLPLDATADIAREWWASGAAERVGGAMGRALGTAWAHREKLTLGYRFFPAIGFLGHAYQFRPDLESRWQPSWIDACMRFTDWGVKLHRTLSSAYKRMLELEGGERSTSNKPEVIAQVIARPLVSAKDLGRDLRITAHTARAILLGLEKRALIYEVTGRGSFRCYGVHT